MLVYIACMFMGAAVGWLGHDFFLSFRDRNGATVQCLVKNSSEKTQEPEIGMSYVTESGMIVSSEKVENADDEDKRLLEEHIRWQMS